MTESEKARAYDKALEKAKKIHDNAKELRCVVEAVNLETIFPELKESEDEKFRKYILQCCKETIQANDSGLELSMDTTKKLKNWLEKQSDKDKLIKELGEYKVKYTQEVLSQQLEKQGNKGKLNNEDICEGCNNFKGCVTCVDGDQWAQYK